MNALTSNEYRDELERLAADERIRAMAEAIPEELRASFDPDDWATIRGAGDEAARRGVPTFSIGGPAKAIRHVLDELA
jgi:hypothetical protein